MEGGCRTPTELKRIDDDGNFDRLRREAEELSNGDHVLCKRILSERLVVEFLKRMNALRVSSREEDPITLPVCRKPRTPRPRRSASFCIRFEPKSKKERKKVIKYSAEEEEELKQLGLGIPLPDEVMTLLPRLGGSTPPVRFIIKHVFHTDLTTHHGRFNLPETKFVSPKEILTEEEWEALEYGTIDVRLVGPMCTEPTSMILKRWKRDNGFIHILTSGWAKFLTKYETKHKGVLREGDGVQVWASRCNGGGLLLALQVIHRSPAARDVADDDQE